MMLANLIRIRQIARAGDTLRAWRLFQDSELASSSTSEALSLKGRLLKDRGLRSEGGQREALLEAAAGAYLASAEGRRATYPLINAATIAFLNGRAAQAEALARQVLAILASGEHEPETRYWLAATSAEAHLLLGDRAKSRAELVEAIAAAPQAWEDHAATLRQFCQILMAQGQDTELLDGLSPPPSLHFSGIIHLNGQEADARARIADVLDRVRPGAVFGALAAGADIVVAELALERGAQVHVVLPTDLDEFRALSVRQFDGDWGARFEHLIEAADSLEIMHNDAPLSAANIAQASQVAMGLALRRSSALATTAISLRISRKTDSVMKAETQWRERGLAYEDIVLDQPPPPSGKKLAAADLAAIVASAAPFPLAPAEASDTVQTDEGMALARFEDPVAAMRFVHAIMEAIPEASMGIDYAALPCGASLETCGERAVLLARGAPAGSVNAPWPQIASMDLLAPEYRFENVGEIVTPLGDFALGRYSLA